MAYLARDFEDGGVERVPKMEQSDPSMAYLVQDLDDEGVERVLAGQEESML